MSIQNDGASGVVPVSFGGLVVHLRSHRSADAWVRLDLDVLCPWAGRTVERTSARRRFRGRHGRFVDHIVATLPDACGARFRSRLALRTDLARQTRILGVFARKGWQGGWSTISRPCRGICVCCGRCLPARSQPFLAIRTARPPSRRLSGVADSLRLSAPGAHCGGVPDAGGVGSHQCPRSIHPQRLGCISVCVFQVPFLLGDPAVALGVGFDCFCVVAQTGRASANGEAVHRYLDGHAGAGCCARHLQC